MPEHLPYWLYPLLLQLHHVTVGSSIALFAARGAATLAGQGWPMLRAWRLASVVIDTVLLAAGASMWFMAGYHPLVQTWLGVKLLLLLLYIVLGSIALKRGRTRPVKAVAYVLALCVVLTMVTIALARDPWGWLAG